MVSLPLFCIVFVIFSLFAVGDVNCRSPPRQDGVVTPWDYGILHLGPLTGSIESTTIEPGDTAVVYTFLKLIKNTENGGFTLRGHVWLFDAQSPATQNGGLWFFSPHEKFYDGSHKTPTFQLRPSSYGVPTGQEDMALTFTVADEKYIENFHDGARTTPYVIELSVPQAWPNEGFFCINNWINKAHFSDVQAVATVANNSAFPSIWSIMKPGFQTAPKLLAHILDTFIHHHCRLGMNGTLQYERGAYLSTILEQSGTRNHIQKGRLLIMWWDHATSQLPSPGEHSDFNRHVHDQYVVHNHAALAFMGTNTYLYFADYDDILIVPQPPSATPLADMLANSDGCLHGNKLVGISRFQYECQPTRLFTKHNLQIPHGQAPESTILMPPNFKCVLVDSFLGSAGQPMSINGFGVDKVLAWADTLRYVGIHNAHMFGRDAKRLGRSSTVKNATGTSCVYVAHLSNWVDLVGEGKLEE